MSDNLPAPVQPMVLVQQLMQRADFTTDMLRDLLDMVKEQEHRADLRLFRAAFHRCQSKVTRAEKNKPNPLFNSRYSTIDKMYDAVWPAVMEEGFCWVVSALTATPEGWDNSVLWFQGRLSKGMVTETVELPVARNALRPEGAKGGRSALTDTQAIGALTTYMRKYLLGLMFSVVTAEDLRLDNDGNRPRVPDPRPQSGNGKPPEPREDTDTQLWLSKVGQALSVMRHQSEVDEAAKGPRVTDARANGEPWVREELDAMFAEAYARTLASEAEG